jgi:hypothetical protein
MLHSFQLKSRRWTIEIAPDRSENLILDGEPCLALIHLRTRKIYVNELLLSDKEELYYTIAHEITHAMIHAHVIDKKTFRDEEFICEFVAIYGAEIVSIAKDLTEILFNNYKKDLN